MNKIYYGIKNEFETIQEAVDNYGGFLGLHDTEEEAIQAMVDMQTENLLFGENSIFKITVEIIK